MEVESRTAVKRGQEWQKGIGEAGGGWVNAPEYRPNGGMISGVLLQHNMTTVYNSLSAIL